MSSARESPATASLATRSTAWRSSWLNRCRRGPGRTDAASPGVLATGIALHEETFSLRRAESTTMGDIHGSRSMSGRCRILFVAVAGLSAVSAYAIPLKRAERDALKATLQNVIDTTALTSARASVLVKSLDDGSVLFSKNADDLLNPASNVKLVTSAAALIKLGSDHRFETEFSTDDQVKDGRAKVLYVHGGGDPTITTERLYAMAGELVHAGLRREIGDIVLDDSYFADEGEVPGFDQETGDRAYLAPAGALSLNWNSLTVYVRPADIPGGKASVEVEPMSDFVSVTSAVTTGRRTQRNFVIASNFDEKRARQIITASGVLPSQHAPWVIYKKIDHPALYFGATLKELLRQRGVKVRGKIKMGVVPTSAKTLWVAQSETLDLVLKKLNKHSSNFIAEMLVKNIGAAVRGAPGTRENGLAVVEDVLENAGIPRGTYLMKNGSGLNDANRFSATQLVQLLGYMWERFPIMPEYLSTLGIAARDGTLRYRFEGSDAAGRLRAKTGTLENVSALSGYVQAGGGERFIFSILVNDFAGRANLTAQAIDALCVAIAASSGAPGGPSSAVASLMPQPVTAPDEALASRMITYGVVAQRKDRRNVPFLRMAWRSERDPAVRGIVADALFQSDSADASNAAQLVVESATDEVLLRLARIARANKVEMPLLPALVELASAGNADATQRLVEFAWAASADSELPLAMSEHFATVAELAPASLLDALDRALLGVRNVATAQLSVGLAKAPKALAKFREAIESAKVGRDPATATFAAEYGSTFEARLEKATKVLPIAAQSVVPSGPDVGVARPGS